MAVLAHTDKLAEERTVRRALVGVLSTGEPSLPRALAGIRLQSEVEVEVVQFADLPEREAHRALYTAFSARSDEFDLLAKVDADMEILHPRLLAAVGVLFERFPQVDLAPVAVDDWLSGRQIWGLNIWRGGVRWLEDPPDLFTDQPRDSRRQTFPLLRVGQPLVAHATEPTPGQALRYGAHRALKALHAADPGRARAVERVVKFCAANPALSRDLVLVAIAWSLSDPERGRELIDVRVPAALADSAILVAQSNSTAELAERALAQIDSLHEAVSSEELRAHRMLHPPEGKHEDTRGRLAWAPRLRAASALRRAKRKLLLQPPDPNRILRVELDRGPHAPPR